MTSQNAPKNPLIPVANIVPIALALLYFLLIQKTMGLRLEHLFLAGFLVSCYFLHPKSRQFAIDFSPMALFGILYDFLRIFPKTSAGHIHVEGPYKLELLLFGFGHPPQTLNEILARHTHTILDVFASLAYAMHVVVPISFSFLMWRKNHREGRLFNATFLLINLMAFATYILLPVAPPWYVAQYGFHPGDWSFVPQAAGMVRFDQLLHFPYFQNIYAKSAWLYGAIPSMHAGFPTLTFLWSLRSFRKLSPYLGVFMVWMWFSAVYLNHHYVIDLIVGVTYVVLAMCLSRVLFGPRKALLHSN